MPFYWTTRIPDNGWYWVRIQEVGNKEEIVKPMFFKTGSNIELITLKSFYQNDLVINYSNQAIREPVKEKKY